MKGIWGQKLGMTQVFDEEGRSVPVTVILAEPNRVVMKRTMARHGYEAVQVGFGRVRPHKLTKPIQGEFRRLGQEPVRYRRELRLPGAADLNEGDEIVVGDTFEAGEWVDVTGTSRGKGFAGVIKRWGFHRGPMTHGSKYHRGVGSLGARMSGHGGRVFKGRKLPGHLGHERVTVQKLKVERVDGARHLLLVRGAVPGPKGGLVMVRASKKAPKTNAADAGKGAR
jgi:large subunit ribosomal protein L3